MGTALKLNHRLRINTLVGKSKFSILDAYLEKIAGKGFDVAAVPFRVLNGLLSSETPVNFEQLIPLARHTAGGQPRLLTAALTDLSGRSHSTLSRIVTDTDAHPMTRFEAMGWAAFLQHRKPFPTQGTSGETPAGDVFQYWDTPVPPVEIQAGRSQWQKVAPTHVWYDDISAQQYVADEFGTDAAQEYAALWHPALKSDVFRLYRLAKSGGVYCDADSQPEYRIPEFLKHAGDRVWASSMTNVPNCAAINGFMVAPASHPMIEGLLDDVLRNIRNTASRGIFWLSGPGAFTNFLYRNTGRFDVALLPQSILKSEVFRQFDAAYKHTEQNWRVYEHNLNIGNDAGLKHVLRNVAPDT